MALVKGLAAISKLLAKQIPGKTQSDILGMLRKSAEGPLRRKFGKNPWYHGTPEQIPEGKVVPFEAFKDVPTKDVGIRELVREGTYVAPEKDFARQMGQRLMFDQGTTVPTNMPLVLRKGTKFLKEQPWWLERAALNPRHDLFIPAGHRESIKQVRSIVQRDALRNDFADELLDALDPNEIKVLERATGVLGSKGAKAIEEYVEMAGWRRGFPGASELKRTGMKLGSRGPDDVLDVITEYNLLPKHLRPTTYEPFSGGPSPDRIEFFEKVARQLGSEYSGQLRKVMEKIGGLLPKVRKATFERWRKRGYSGYKGDPDVEAVIWPGEEKKVLRHVLADFKEEYGGITAGLLPLISLLRGKREE